MIRDQSQKRASMEIFITFMAKYYNSTLRFLIIEKGGCVRNNAEWNYRITPSLLRLITSHELFSRLQQIQNLATMMNATHTHIILVMRVASETPFCAQG